MKIHRKILMSFITIILLLLTLSASTYAWIYNTKEAYISGFDFQAVSGYGFQISVDGSHYKTQITTEEIKEAIVYSLYPNTYIFTEDGQLAEKTTDDEGNEIAGNVLSSSDVDSKITNKLRPMTSTNGYSFMGLGNTTYKDSDYLSNCIEFSLYFQTTSRVESDNLSYNIYINGSDYTNTNGTKVKKTTLSAGYDSVTLSAPLVTDSRSYSAGDTITVCSANAMRFSTDEVTTNTVTTSLYIKVSSIDEYVVDNEYYNFSSVDTAATTFDNTKTYYVVYDDTSFIASTDTEFVSGTTYYEKALVDNVDNTNYKEYYVAYDMTETTTDHNAQIFEFYDSKDLGSYATDYTEENYTDYDVAIGKLYDSTKSASFTYYNNKKSQSQQLTALSYKNELPAATRFSIDDDSLNTSSTTKIQVSNNVETIGIGDPITTVNSSDKEGKKVTFRFWLEGWDADCFDGIAQSISVSLTFVSKQN